jgi:hypothetical protein
MLILLRLFVFGLGLLVVAGTLVSAIRTFVLPRSAPDTLTRVVFVTIRSLFALRLRGARTYAERDRALALYAPFSLLALPPTWLTLVLLGYMGMFWALGAPSWGEAFRVSGSSLLTLGIAAREGLAEGILMFSEAAMGLILVALLIAYLPTMYAAFSQREALVTLLEVRAGSPPSAVEMIKRFQRIHGLDSLGDLWAAWEVWFAQLEESHSSLPALAFFRSPQPDHSWVTASGAVMDAAALMDSTVDEPRDPRAALCIRAGYLALRRISDFFGLRYNPDPHYPAEPISVTREEFDAACEDLAAQGVPLKADRDQAWRDFAGWRVNYDRVLIALCTITTAPAAPWSSDRAPAYRVPPLFQRVRPR